jgi:parallel beta-helix repeat protein
MTRERSSQFVHRRARRLTGSARVLMAAVVAAVMVAPLAAVTAPRAAAATEATFHPVADSYVDSSNPSSNFGTRTELRTDGSPAVNAYLRFDVTGLSGAVPARLRLYMRSAASGGVQIRSVADDAWSEATITWNSAPAYGPVVATSGAAVAGSWVEIDVSPLVTQAGLVSLAITTASSTAVAIRSRESAETPELIVGAAAANQAPTAAFGYSCSGLTCSFDASASRDPDGTIVKYAWEFDTDGTGSGVAAGHTFSSAGSHPVTLTVTDDRGATGSVTHAVSVGAPPTGTSFAVSRSGSSYTAVSSSRTFTGSLKTVVEGAVAQLQLVGGGTITFGAGDFDLGGDWFLLHDIVNITFQGAGMGRTIIHNNTSIAADTEPFNVSNANGMVVRDLTVNAGGSARTTSDALDFDRGNHVLVERVEVTGSRARGIIFDGKNAGWTADYNTIRDCVISGVASQGIELLASNHDLVEGCTITNSGSHGIEIAKASAIADQANKPSDDNVIRNNTIVGSGENGIYVNSGSRNTVTGNVVRNSSRVVSSRDGIRIASSDARPCDDNVVDANTATDTQAVKTQAWGLRIASAGCHRTVVGAANAFDGNRLGAVLDQGTATIFAAPTGDSQAPTKPTGLVATAASGCRVDLAWVASTDNVGVAGYGIYRGGTLIDSVGGSTLTYADTGVVPGSTLSYQVDAVDASGNRSSRSDSAVSTTPSTACGGSLVPTADSYVEASKPTTNNGTKTQIRVDGSPAVTTYLAFDVPAVGTLSRATLRLWANSSQSSGIAVHVGSSSSWTEAGITYANAPVYGAVVGSSGPVGAGSWLTVDVTSAIAGSGRLTLVLTTASSTALSLASRESGATAPQLVISGP